MEGYYGSASSHGYYDPYSQAGAPAASYYPPPTAEYGQPPASLYHDPLAPHHSASAYPPTSSYHDAPPSSYYPPPPSSYPPTEGKVGTAPNGNTTSRICDYYLAPRGCVKGSTCDFLHPGWKTGSSSSSSSIAPPGTESNGSSNGSSSASSASGKDPTKKVCQYFMTTRGCAKGDICDFFHPPPGSGPVKSSKPCSFYFSPRGCVKGNVCDYSHGEIREAPRGPSIVDVMGGVPPGMMSSSRAVHPAHASGYGPVRGYTYSGHPSRPLKQRLCEFFSSERGCIKGEVCDFMHIKQRTEICSYFNTEKGCKKGAVCEFKHAHKDSADASAASASGSLSSHSDGSSGQDNNPAIPEGSSSDSQSSKGHRYAPY